MGTGGFLPTPNSLLDLEDKTFLTAALSVSPRKSSFFVCCSSHHLQDVTISTHLHREVVNEKCSFSARPILGAKFPSDLRVTDLSLFHNVIFMELYAQAAPNTLLKLSFSTGGENLLLNLN